MGYRCHLAVSVPQLWRKMMNCFERQRGSGYQRTQAEVSLSLSDRKRTQPQRAGLAARLASELCATEFVLWISLNIVGYRWMFLNIVEFHWVSWVRRIEMRWNYELPVCSQQDNLQDNGSHLQRFDRLICLSSFSRSGIAFQWKVAIEKEDPDN